MAPYARWGETVVEAAVLNVFVDEQGGHGNPVGIVIDEKRQLDSEERLKISQTLGFSESVFVNSLETMSISIFNPQQEIAFSGHAAIGAAWYIEHSTNRPVSELAALEGTIRAWSEDDLVWVECELRSTPPWCIENVNSAAVLEKLTGPLDACEDHTLLWAWTDEINGKIRGRTFASAWGIAEDEANGSGCMRLASVLGKAIEVRHGIGSVVYARPERPGYTAAGGRVSIKEKRTV
jgi:predicted PhzF superfamily epimerase YddE/YHI9